VSTALLAVSLALVAVGGAVVVSTGEPRRQAVCLSVFGLLLALLFVVLQAPDVALSQIAVGTTLVPLMVLLAVHKTGTRR
jgi:uncharacterized MnhB-related membrane protein